MESSTFDEYVNVGKIEITKYLLQQCQESSSFQKLMEMPIESDKQKYFLMLTSKGVKIPAYFDLENVRNTDERISQTKARTYAYNTQN